MAATEVFLAFGATLQDLEVSQYLRASSWGYPLLNAIHIAGIGLLFGAIAVVDVGILRRGRADRTSDALPARIAVLGFCIAATTGLVLFAVQAVAYASNPFMGLKLLLITLAGLNALGLRWTVNCGGPTVSLWQRGFAVSSVVLWLMTIWAGRMIGFW